MKEFLVLVRREQDGQVVVKARNAQEACELAEDLPDHDIEWEDADAHYTLEANRDDGECENEDEDHYDCGNWK